MNREEAAHIIGVLEIKTMEEAFIEGFEMGSESAEPRWNDAESLLPQMELTVLCHNGVMPFLASRCSEGKTGWHWEDSYGKGVFDVKYWMFIPLP